MKLEPINLASLRLEKGFQKTAKKQQKEVDTMKKRQLKERQAIQKNQCLAIEKLVKGIRYVRDYLIKFFHALIPINSKDNVMNDASVLKCVKEQNAQWSEMLEKHQREEWEFMKQQLQDQQETLKKLMEVSQQVQMKQIEAKHERFAETNHFKVQV